MKLIGLDIGTTSICSVVLDVATGQLVESMTRSNTATKKDVEHWAKLQDPTIILAIAEKLIDDILGRHDDIAGIGLSGQMHGILYLDAQGEPVSPLYTWQDGRGNLIDRDQLTYADALKKQTGYAVYSGFGLVTHYYHVKTGRVPKAASAICTIADFVAMKLARCARPVMDATQAASLGLFAHDSFDDKALRAAGISPDILPEVAQAVACIGCTAKQIPVFTSLGDNQASFLGSVGSLTDSLLINVGTGSQLSLWSSETLTIPGWEVRPFPGEGHLHVAAILSGGKSYALLESFFRQVINLFGNSNGDHLAPDLYERMAETLDQFSDSTNPLEVIPHFYGTRLNPQERGSIMQMNETNFTPQHLMAALLRGMSDELYLHFLAVPNQWQIRASRIVGSGNGLRKNAHLRSMLAHRFSMPVMLPLHNEEAAVGAALYAGVGVGCYTDFDQAAKALI